MVSFTNNATMNNTVIADNAVINNNYAPPANPWQAADTEALKNEEHVAALQGFKSAVEAEDEKGLLSYLSEFKSYSSLAKIAFPVAKNLLEGKGVASTVVVAIDAAMKELA